jgi:uncharacterized protein
MSAEGGFYSALDADSEGEEGKFYVWEKTEIDQVLGPAAGLFNRFYGVSETGNWEGTNILHVPLPAEAFAKSLEGGEEGLWGELTASRARLLEIRGKRPRPLLDDKMLLSWNALMNTACSKAYAATGEEHYRDLAIRNMQFVVDNFSAGPAFYHTCKNGQAKFNAFLDDYAFLVQALIHLQEITCNTDYLLKAKDTTAYVLDGFMDPQAEFFFYTHREQEDVIVRKKEIYDGAVPSGNSVMAGNLLYLSHVFDEKEWGVRTEAMLGALTGLVTRHPGSFGGWANQLLVMTEGIKELVVTGQKINEILFDILHIFIPGRILQSSSVPIENFPLLAGKQYVDPFSIYWCENYVCKPPLNSLSDFIQLYGKQ